jgi:hypothetical protein
VHSHDQPHLRDQLVAVATDLLACTALARARLTAAAFLCCGLLLCAASEELFAAELIKGAESNVTRSSQATAMLTAAAKGDAVAVRLFLP